MKKILMTILLCLSFVEISSARRKEVVEIEFTKEITTKDIVVEDGSGITIGTGAKITGVTTNSAATNETEVMTAGAVGRAVATAGNIIVTNNPSTIDDVLRVSETGASGRTTMRYSPKIWYYIDKNGVDQNINNNTSTRLTWATNNISEGISSLFSLTDDDGNPGTTHIQYNGASDIYVKITYQVNMSNFTGSGKYFTMWIGTTPIGTLTQVVLRTTGSGEHGASTAKTALLSQGDKVWGFVYHAEGSTIPASGKAYHTFILIQEL